MTDFASYRGQYSAQEVSFLEQFSNK